MGSNLLLNMADHGFKVVGYDTNAAKTAALESSASPNTVVKGVNSLEQMIAALQKPRKIMMLVPAGAPVDSVIKDLSPHLEKGDLIIDAGNSYFTFVGGLVGDGAHRFGRNAERRQAPDVFAAIVAEGREEQVEVPGAFGGHPRDALAIRRPDRRILR